MCKRKKFLDYCRGFAIFLVIVVHCTPGHDPLKTWITAFFMPIFFIIGGILIEYRYPNGMTSTTLGSYILKLCRQLLVPYFFWGTILILFYESLLIISGSPSKLIERLSSLILFKGIDSLWFIPIYLISEIIIISIFQRLSIRNKWICLGLGILVISILNHYKFPYNQPYCHQLYVELLGLIFIAVGVLIEHSKLIYRTEVGLPVSLLLLGTVGSLYNHEVGMNSLELGNIILYFFDAIALSLSIIIIFYIVSQKNISEKIFKIFDVFGKNSIIILCTNNLIIESIRLIDYKLTGDAVFKNGIAGIALMVLVVSFVEYFLILFFSRRFSVLFGKSKLHL